MDLQKEKSYTYFNGTLTGEVNKIFKDIINCEVTRPSYSDKKRPTHFALKKRSGYKRLSVGLSTRGVTDVKVIQGGACGLDEDTTFLFLLSPDKTQYQIWKRPNSCAFEAELINSGSTCICGYNRFLEVEYAKGQPRTISSFSFTGGVQSSGEAYNRSFGVGTTVQGRFRVDDGTLRDINFGTSAGQVQIGDYLVIRTAPLYTSGQAKRITGYDSTNKELILDTPWTGFPSGTDLEEGVTASTYPSWGSSLMFNNNSGPVVLNVDYVSGSTTETILELQIIQGKCITSMGVSDGIWNFLTSEGYLVFGGAGLDVAYFSGSELVGDQFNNIIPFRGYNVLTGDRNIRAGIVSVSGSSYMQNIYDIPGSMGLRSKNAFTLFNNSLFIVGSNGRLYAVSISGSGGVNINPQLDLKSMSEPIVGELELLRDGDDVSLFADEKTMRLFINRDGKTKILVYESDYGLWHTHKIMNANINGLVEGFFIGDGLYRYCGITDGALIRPDGTIDTTQGEFFTQKISAIIGENEPNGMSFNVFQEKRIDAIKTNIGPSILNDGTSYVEIESNRAGYKSKVKFNNWSNIDRVQNYNTIFAGGSVALDACVLSNVVDCEVIENEFEGSDDKDSTFGSQSTLLVDDLCQCPNTYYEKSDMVDGYDSKAYFLSDSYNVLMKSFDVSRSSLYKVSFISKEGDRLWFNGFFAQLIQDNLDTGDIDGSDILTTECSAC